MIGRRYFGLPGALTALAGMLAAPLIVLLLLALLYARFAAHPGVAGALRGMGAVAAGLIIATGIRLGNALSRNVLPSMLCAVIAVSCFVMVGWLRWPLLFVLPVAGLVACFLAYRRIRR